MRYIFNGACFLVGSGYQLQDVKERLNDPRIVTMAMNNSATQFTPNLWIGADTPEHYSHSILFNPTIMKFVYLLHANNVVGGRPTRELANVHFMARADATAKDFFAERKTFGWWRNVQVVAMEVLRYLGFSRIYFVGTGLSIKDDKPYAYDSDLAEDEIQYNRLTYSSVVEQTRTIHAAASAHGLDLISCTPDSKLNDFMPYMTFEAALETETAKVPPPCTKGFVRPSHTGLLGKPKS